MRILSISLLLASASLAVAAVVTPHDASACTCGPVGSGEMVDRVDVILVGRFVSSTGLVEGLGVRETLLVERYLKGSGPETIDVYDSPSTCGVMLGANPDERWLVFATLGDTGVLQTGKCHGTIVLDPPDPYTDEAARGAGLRELETVLGTPGVLVAPSALPDGGQGNLPTNSLSPWLVPLLAAGAAAGVAGLALLAAQGSRARP
jgi:hypothetical protein